MSITLRLIEDRVAAAESLTFDALNRVIYVAGGSIEIEGSPVPENDAWFGPGAVSLRAGPAGARLWRFELTRESAADPAEKLRAPIETLDPGDGRRAFQLFQASHGAGRHRHSRSARAGPVSRL